ARTFQDTSAAIARATRAIHAFHRSARRLLRKCHRMRFLQRRTPAARERRYAYPGCVGGGRVMPGYTDKSRRYLRLADEQTHRAQTALCAHTRSMFLALARQYRELAGQIDDPARWRVRMAPAGSSRNAGARTTRADQ